MQKAVMPEFSSPLSLRELLKLCTNRTSPEFERAWKVLMARYETYIYTQIRRQCVKWKSERLQLQLDEVAQDIFTKIIEEFCTHDLKALRDFRGSEIDEDNERMFLGWLAVICHNQSNRELRKRWWRVIQSQDSGKLPETIWELETDMIWMLYRDVVCTLRDGAHNKKLERDMHIFLLFTFGGFTEAMIRVTAYMEKLGNRVIQVVINRMREKLRKRKNDFF